MSDSPYRYNEIDFLSALLAFQAGQISPEVLRQAIHNYANSSGCSLCENVEALAEVELDAFVAAARRQLRDAAQAAPSEAFVSPAASTAAANSETSVQQQPSWVEDETDPSETDSWQRPTEFWSHIYYADDVIRSYTAGWMGLGATVGIAGAIVAIVWVVLAFPSTIPHDSLTHRPVPATTTPDDESTTADSEPESSKPADRQAKNSSVVLASKNEDESSLKSPLAGLLSEADKKSKTVPTPVDLDPVVDLIESKDLPAALKLLEKICAESNSPDEACERLAIGIRLEMESDSSVQEAGERIAALKDFDHPATTLLFCRWAMNATQDQRVKLYQRFQDDEEKKLAVRWLSSLCGGHVDAVKELSVTADNLNAIPTNLFLASAHFRSAERQQALEQLDALDRQLKEPKSWFAEDRSERWLMASSIAAITRGAAQLRSKLEIRR